MSVPGLQTQQAAALPRGFVATDAYTATTTQGLPDNWGRPLVVDNLEGTAVLPMVSPLFVTGHDCAVGSALSSNL